MESAASAPPAAGKPSSARGPRQGRTNVSRRAGLQLLAGVLIVAAIPIVSTVRILTANALRNERAHADAALRTQLQSAVRELGQIGDDASTRIDDLARTRAVQHAF